LGALLVILGLTGLAIHIAIDKPASPYRVTFGKVGDPCTPDAKYPPILDEVAGGLLTCGVARFSDSADVAQGVFSADEVQKITGLSRSLATDGSLSAADQQTVENLAVDIGRQHGRRPTSHSTLDRVTGTDSAWFLALGLLSLFIAERVWARTSRPSPP
jgi:hypothetical protein